MRVLHVVGDSRFGGGVFMVGSIADMAKGLGWEVDVLATDPLVQASFKRHGIGIVNLDSIHRPIDPIDDYRAYRILRKYLELHPYDIVHTHTSKAGVLGRRAAYHANVPAILHTVHGFAFHEESRFLSTLAYSTIERIASRWCDAIVTVSDFHKRWAENLGIAPPPKIHSIPNGMDPERVRALTCRDVVRVSLGLSFDDICILSVGRLARQKGLAYLLNAVPLLDRSIAAKCKVFLVGEGEMKGMLEHQSRRLRIQSKVNFLGFRRDIGDLLSAADIVALPSLWEGLSIALLEAMAAGKPIVTTSIGSNVEVVSDDVEAMIVPPKDPQCLADAVTRLALDRDKRERLGAAARKRFENNYTLSRMQDGYRELYLSLVRAKGLVG